MSCKDCSTSNVSFFPVLNQGVSPCSTGDCESTIDSKCVIYSGATLNVINPSSLDIETIIIKINDILANLGDGVINWEEIDTRCLGGTSSLYDFILNVINSLCDLEETVSGIEESASSFESSTDDRLVLLEVPNITTCGTLGLTSVDTLQQVLTKLKNAICANKTALDISGITWDVCGFSTTPPASIKTAFVSILEMICSIKNSLPEIDSLPTFDNRDCLNGSAIDNLETTIDLLKIAVCEIDGSFNAALLDFECVSSGGDLQTTIQNIITAVSDVEKGLITAIDTNYFELVDVGSSGSCLGKKLNFIYPITDENVAIDNTDTPGYLIDKLEGLNSLISIDVTKVGTKLRISASIDDEAFISHILNTININSTLKNLFCSIVCESADCAPSSLTTSVSYT